jgi:hypothetical protein
VQDDLASTLVPHIHTSKMNNRNITKPLTSIQNTGRGKAAADNVSEKTVPRAKLKLKSFERTMSPAVAKVILIAGQRNPKIYEPSTVEELESTMLFYDAGKWQLSDTEQILHRSNVFISNHPIKDQRELSRNLMDDILALHAAGECHERDVLQVATRLGSKTLQIFAGAFDSLLTQRTCVTFHQATRALYMPTLRVRHLLDSCHVSTLSTIACAICMTDSEEKDGDLLVAAVLAKAKDMETRQIPMCGGNYHPCQDMCPIIDLLHPTWEDTKRFNNPKTKNMLRAAIRAALETSVNSAPPALNYAMPKEARIAFENGLPDLQDFLRSPHETCVSLRILSSAGETAISRLITNKMKPGTLIARFEGTRDRKVVIQKGHAETPEMTQARRKRKETHKKMLKDMTR